MPILGILQGPHTTAKRINIAKLTTKTLGIICMTNCDCKNGCSAMFSVLDKGLEKMCRGWCDEVKARKNNLMPQDDLMWTTAYEQGIKESTGMSPDYIPDEPPPGEGNTSFWDFLDDFMPGGGNGGGGGYTPPPPPIKSEIIAGVPNAVTILGGAAIVGGTIYLATRPKPKRRNN